MVLGELLSSLWTSTNNDKEKKETPRQGSIGFPQGAQLLRYKQEKTQQLNKRAEMLTDSNGYSQTETLQAQNKLNTTANQSMNRNLSLVEGFTGMIGPTAANQRNERDLDELQRIENNFNRKLSNYATAHKTLMDKSQRFITENDSANIYANKNVRLADGNIGYVSPRGNFKLYPSQDVFNATAGKNGCPANYVNVNVTPNNLSQGSTIETSPSLKIGTPMQSGQACGDENVNIFVTQAANPTTVNAKFEGCYKITSNDGMIFQEDLGDKVSEEVCKTRALDLGYSVFSLRDDGTGCSKCYVGNNLNSAKTGGQATKSMTSYRFVENSDANSSGLLMNGQIGVGKDIQIGQGAKAKTAVNCPKGYDTTVQANNKCIAGWSGPKPGFPNGFGEGQAKNSCSAAGGKWIPLDYSNHPYTCQMPDSTNMKTQFEASEGCLPIIGAEINPQTIVGTYGGNCQAKPSIKCPTGYSGPNANNECIAGWSYACGEGCAKSKCAAANGEWIPLDYSNHPYTCKMKTPTPQPSTPLVPTPAPLPVVAPVVAPTPAPILRCSNTNDYCPALADCYNTCNTDGKTEACWQAGCCPSKTSGLYNNPSFGYYTCPSSASPCWEKCNTKYKPTPTPAPAPTPAPTPVVAPVVAPAPKPTPIDNYTKVPNMDIGGWLEHLPGQTPEQLATKCDADKNCVAFNSGGWTKWMTGPQVKSTLDSYISKDAPSNLPQYKVSSNTDAPGAFGYGPGKNAFELSQMCNDKAGCKGFNHDPINTGGWLKNIVSPTHPYQGLNLYVKQ